MSSQSYEVLTEFGKVLRRNRRHLRLQHCTLPEHPEENDEGALESDCDPESDSEQGGSEGGNEVGQHGQLESETVTRSGRRVRRPAYLADYDTT